VKRISTGLVSVVAVVTLGVLASACGVTPDAASVNGGTISVSSLNSQMAAFDTSGAAGCLLELQNRGMVAVAGDGLGGTGTRKTGFATTLLSNDIGNLLGAQYAASLGVHLTGTEVANAQNQYVSGLDTALTTSQQSGGTVRCVKADGSPYTGQTLLAALPATLRDNEIADRAVFEALLVRGADVSDAAVLGFYAAHPSDFTTDCVSAIVVKTQAEADQIVGKLQRGASFGDLAKSTSTDARSAASGGQIGCSYTETRVLQALQLNAVVVGKPVAPIQGGSGTWEVYEVTGRTVVPVTVVQGTIRRALLHQVANTSRVSSEILAFARRSSITVNPQYGTWAGLRIAPPAQPPARYLLPASPEAAVAPSTPGGTTPVTTAGG
jgi:hypothetical protein